MSILRATILKDLRILFRDRTGLIMMFFMPVLLVVIITSVQNSTFDLVNNNKISLLIYNRDPGEKGAKLVEGIEKVGMFRLVAAGSGSMRAEITARMQAKDALVALEIPADFSKGIDAKAADIAARSLKDIDSAGADHASPEATQAFDSLRLYYHPVLQQSFRASINGALESAVRVVEGEAILRELYGSLHTSAIPPSLEKDIIGKKLPLAEVPVARNGSKTIPNASQHNVPAWTIFAMFFIVISLGTGVVREKSTGSFLRLKTLPASYLYATFSKQIVYVAVTVLQAAVIFSIGYFLFPHIGLPRLHMPADLGGLLLVTVVCGWCAVSYAVCVGVFANTPEQANGFGAISILILAALGGLLVPSFAMPASFQPVVKLSPLHWCLEAYYGLFLEGGRLRDVFMNILSLIAITVLIQCIIFFGLRRKNLI